MSHDLVIRDGNIVDGTGEAAFVGDVAVDGDLITEVGYVSGKGAREINAEGLSLIHISEPTRPY